MFNIKLEKKSQKMSFKALPVNFINYFKFWTTHCKLSVIICITYYVDICYKQKEITKKDIKKKWTEYGALYYSM